MHQSIHFLMFKHLLWWPFPCWGWRTLDPRSVHPFGWCGQLGLPSVGKTLVFTSYHHGCAHSDVLVNMCLVFWEQRNFLTAWNIFWGYRRKLNKYVLKVLDHAEYCGWILWFTFLLCISLFMPCSEWPTWSLTSWSFIVPFSMRRGSTNESFWNGIEKCKNTGMEDTHSHSNTQPLIFFNSSLFVTFHI